MGERTARGGTRRAVKAPAVKPPAKAPAVTARRAGRQPAPVDEALVFELASIACTSDEIATICHVSRDIIERRFADTLERGRAHRNESLRRKQFALAMEGHTGMLVWLGKQYLGQKERHDVTSDDKALPTFTLNLGAAGIAMLGGDGPNAGGAVGAVGAVLNAGISGGDAS